MSVFQLTNNEAPIFGLELFFTWKLKRVASRQASEHEDECTSCMLWVSAESLPRQIFFSSKMGNIRDNFPSHMDFTISHPWEHKVPST